jgi:hypothetical protein
MLSRNVRNEVQFYAAWYSRRTRHLHRGGSLKSPLEISLLMCFELHIKYELRVTDSGFVLGMYRDRTSDWLHTGNNWCFPQCSQEDIGFLSSGGPRSPYSKTLPAHRLCMLYRGWRTFLLLGSKFMSGIGASRPIYLILHCLVNLMRCLLLRVC